MPKKLRFTGTIIQSIKIAKEGDERVVIVGLQSTLSKVVADNLDCMSAYETDDYATMSLDHEEIAIKDALFELDGIADGDLATEALGLKDFVAHRLRDRESVERVLRFRLVAKRRFASAITDYWDEVAGDTAFKATFTTLADQEKLALEAGPEDAETPPKRKRGRPRKQPAEAPLASASDMKDK